MSSFDTGMRLGMAAMQQGIENRRQAAIDEQNAWRFENEKKDRARTDSQNSQLDTIYSGLQAQPDQYTMPAATFGPADAHVDPYALGQAQQQGVGSVADTPQGFGAGTPAMAIKGRPPAQGRDLYQGLMNAALVRRDDKAIGDYQGKLDTFDKGDIIASASKMSGKDLETWAHSLNGAGRSTLPVYYAGPASKDGYQRLLLKKPDGSATTIDLNDAQLKQLYVADQLGQDPRFAAEALTMAAGVHKDIDALVAQYNTQVKGATEGNNVAQAAADKAAYQQGHLDVMRDSNAISREQGNRPNWVITGQGEDGSVVGYDSHAASFQQASAATPPGFKPSRKAFGSDPAEKARLDSFYKALQDVPLPKDSTADATYRNQLSALADRYQIPKELVGLKPVGQGWPAAPGDVGTPKFQVSGDPAQFRATLVRGGAEPSAIAAFDQQYPQVAAPRQAAIPQRGQSSVGLGMTGNAQLDNLRSGDMQVLDQLRGGVKQAEGYLAAAAKSGDPRATNAYAAQLQQARDALRREAVRRLGNNAEAYLNQD